ncbi:MAG: hypothetical protein M0R67_06735 [Candidatus Cloacimonas sp.]|jgi:hypothetical protein|nr:hypothetical protein [Candidatus Cloacimonas sp.]
MIAIYLIVPLLLFLCLLTADKKENYGSIYGSITEAGKNKLAIFPYFHY